MRSANLLTYLPEPLLVVDEMNLVLYWHLTLQAHHTDTVRHFSLAADITAHHLQNYSVNV